MTVGGSELHAVRYRRDRSRGGERHQLADIPGHMSEVDDQRMVVGRLQPRDRLCLPVRYIREAFNRLIEIASRFPSTGRAFKGAHDIRSEDLGVCEWRPVAKASSQSEGPG